MLGGANDSRAGYESARLELARLRLGGGDARALAQVAEDHSSGDAAAFWARHGDRILEEGSA